MNQRASILALAIALLGGCSSASGPYPGTDVIELPDLELVRATDLHHSGGTLQSGTLEYAGEGDLKGMFREYVSAMTALGWTTTQSNISDQLATAILRKDNRTATLDFRSRKGQVTAVVRVAEAATPNAQ